MIHKKFADLVSPYLSTFQKDGGDNFWRIFVSLTPPKVSSELPNGFKEKMFHMGIPYRDSGGVMKFVYVYLVSSNFVLFLDAKLQLHKLCYQV